MTKDTSSHARPIQPVGRRRRLRSTTARQRRRRSYPGFEALEPRLPLTSVVSLSPLGGTFDAPVDTLINATFDMPLDSQTLNDQSFVVHTRRQGQLLTAEGEIDLLEVEGSTIRFASAADFASGERIELTASSSVMDAMGVGITPHVWSFQTGVAAGAGMFRDTTQELGTTSTYDAALADVDGDGDLDAVTANFAVGTEGEPNRVWLNNGNGDFVNSGQRLGQSLSRAVAVGDLDGDGDVDAVFANSRMEPNTVWLNDGAGVFYDSGQALGNADSRDIDLADFDGDGDLDMVTANELNHPNLIWLNDGNGGFSASGQGLGSSRTRAVAVGDLDADGDVDAVFGNIGSQPAEVWLNDGTGQFLERSHSLGTAATRDIELGDFDADGDLDAFVANTAGGPNEVWLNDGSGTFVDTGQQLGAANSYGVAIGDLDADGDLDAVTGDRSTANHVWLNDGLGNFASGQLMGDSASHRLALGDLDADGDVDLWTTNFEEANEVWLNEELSAADFNFDASLDCTDIDALVSEIAAGTHGPAFDLDADDLVNHDDLTLWLSAAGAVNLESGSPYLPGDADLDGAVDLTDLHAWNQHKFTTSAAWCSGDFDASGVVDVLDFDIWNDHKFTTSDGASAASGGVRTPVFGMPVSYRASGREGFGESILNGPESRAKVVRVKFQRQFGRRSHVAQALLPVVASPHKSGLLDIRSTSGKSAQATERQEFGLGLGEFERVIFQPVI